MHTDSFLARAATKVYSNLRQFFGHRLALATGLTFACDSLMFGSWVAYIPHVKSNLGLNDAELGLALFGMPVGLLAMNPFSAGILQRVGLARATVGSTLVMALGFALPIWMPERWSFMVALAFIGGAVALMNVAMNTCATNIERADNVHIMSSCHGMWSLAGMVGSGVAAGMIALQVPPRLHLGVAAALVALGAWFWLRPTLAEVPEAPRTSSEPVKKFAFPSRDLLLMVFVGLCVSLGEGVAFDWSAVYLRDSLGAPAQIAALGFTFFSLTMMALRFIGDVLVPHFGERNMLFFTVLCSIFALVVIVLAPLPWVGLLGFLLLGAGVSLGAPILFNAAARAPGLAPGAGLATYATFSFVGFLAGPPVIGFVGEKYGLEMGFLLVAALFLLALVAARRVRL
jgi:MFS family permease